MQRSSRTPAGVATSNYRQAIRWRWRSAFVVLLATAFCYLVADWWIGLPQNTTATHVGRTTCMECHQPQSTKWHASHHDLAMDLARPDTVLGDFNNAEIDHFGLTSKMFSRGGRYFAHTEGPDGNMADFEIKYVFGVDPLQQYMVEFDRPADMPANEIARLQVLRLSWDTQKNEWFYLPPPDVDEKLSPDDVLHWTGIAQRWNTMCAECHSTNLEKNYDPLTQTYHTTFAEIDVSCEACHGPGSIHVQLANTSSLFWDRHFGYGLAALKDADSHKEIDTCAQCHSLRPLVHPDYTPGEPFHDAYAHELLVQNHYYPDGQILGEVYVHGSFLQSKMYHKGIRCTDCHDPHSLQLKHSGNQLCTSCHTHSAGKLDGAIHHHHQPGSSGASCVECHMPETTFMEVDPRRDHSLRIPRPDLSIQLQTPNACSRCHLNDARHQKPQREDLKHYADWLRAGREGDTEVAEYLTRLDRWSADHFETWYGTKKDLESHFAKVLHGARRGEPTTEKALIDIVSNPRHPDILRATALREMGRFPSRAVLNATLARLTDDHPQLRSTALANLRFLSPEQLVTSATPLLSDPLRLVRIEAARALAHIPAGQFAKSQQQAFNAALKEYKEVLAAAGDHALAHAALGSIHEARGELAAAIEAYETAIRVEPTATGPRGNLAAIFETRATEILRSLSTQEAESSPQGQQARDLKDKAILLRTQELKNLKRDVDLAPKNASLQYQYGLAVYLDGDYKKAENALLKACQLEPNTADFPLAVALLYQKQERWKEAVVYAGRALHLRPRDQGIQQLRRDLEHRDQAASQRE